MAGLSGPQAVVDITAAAEKLRPSSGPAAPAEPEKRPEVPEQVMTDAGPPCALGHPNPHGTRFCGSCGLPMDAELPVPGSAPMRPRPAAELSPAERAERERQHAEAIAAARQFEGAPAQYVPAEGEAVLIHFVADGLTAFGQVWYRGQELAIGPSHPRWGEAVGWITLTRFQQVDRWGEQKFDFGPWPGRRSYTEALGSFEQLASKRDSDGKLTGIFAGPTEEELRRADQAEAARGRAVPAPAFR